MVWTTTFLLKNQENEKNEKKAVNVKDIDFFQCNFLLVWIPSDQVEKTISLPNRLSLGKEGNALFVRI